MTLEFHYSFGFRNTRKSVAFYDSDSVIFAAGKMCVIFDLKSRKQKYFHFAERSEISAVMRCGILVGACIVGNPPSVCLFNTLSETKKFYSAPDSMESSAFVCLSVSVSLKFLAAQAGRPDWTLVIWLTQTREIVALVNPLGKEGLSVNDILFHAAGHDEIVVVGKGVFKLYEYQDENGDEKSPFAEHVFEKYERSSEFYAIAWPQKENLAVGNSKGEILYFRGIEVINEMSVTDDATDLLKREFGQNEESNLPTTVTSIVVTSQQLLCIFAELVVLIYSGEEIAYYTLHKWILLPAEEISQSIPGEINPEMDRLAYLVLSPNEKDLVGTTRKGQLLYCCAFSEGEEQQQFTNLLHQQHMEPVTDLDVARSRPILATCSKNIVILWNYCNKKQELKKGFKNEIWSVAVHPTGLFLALGFDLHCRVFSILYDGLRERALLSSKHCRQISFCSGGHLLAVGSDLTIEIYYFVSCSLLFKLIGHAGTITCLAWKDQDCKLVSCDTRGVLCEWDLISRTKLWEYTLIVSYSSVGVNPLTGDALVVGSDRAVRCFNNAYIQWIFESNKDLTSIALSWDGKTFHVGTEDGCIETHSFPSTGETASVSAHSGKILRIKHNFKYDFLISAGSDGFIFMWKTTEGKNDEIEGIFSDLTLVNRSDLMKSKDQIKLLSISLQHTDTSRDCDFELNCVKQEEMLRKMALDHTRMVDALNNKIAHIKEEMQIILFETDPKEEVKDLEALVRQEIINTTKELNKAYKLSNAYFIETEEIVLNYETEIDSLSKKHAKFSCAQRNAIEDIIEKIKVLEETLNLEKGITKETLLRCEEYKKNIQKEVCNATGDLTSSKKAMLDAEKTKSADLQFKIEKLKQLIAFKMEDTQNKSNIASGQVDYDIREKVHAVSLLKKDYHKLESTVEAKEKITQSQEKKFCEMRKSVGGFQRCHSVSKTAIGELLEDIQAKTSEIEFCRKKIKEVAESIPCLEEEIQLTEDLCSTVTEKLGETVDGFQKKQKMLRDLQDVISKYSSMLHQCLLKTCDPFELVRDILKLFEESRVDVVDEIVDSDLRQEFEFQVKNLKNSYDFIKGEPDKAMRDKSMAEFRLSQENSKILREIHEIQKENERLDSIMYDMEGALGMHTKGGKAADELRCKIEFVIEASKVDRAEKVRQISRLDTLIEEQQREIQRFQTILSGKLKQEHHQAEEYSEESETDSSRETLT